MPEYVLLPPKTPFPLLFTGIPEFSWGGNVRRTHPLYPTPVLVSWIKQTKKSFASLCKSRRNRKSGSWSRIPIFGVSLLLCRLFSLKRQRCILSPSGSSFGWISGADLYPWPVPAGRRTAKPGMARRGPDHRGLLRPSAAPTGASRPPRRPQRGRGVSSRES